MRVRKRLRINTLVTVITTLIILFVIFLTLHRINKANNEAKIAGEIMATILERVTLKNDYIRNNTERARAQLFSKLDRLDGLLKTASKEFTNSDDRITIDEFQEDHKSVRRLFVAIVENRKTGETRRATDSLAQETEERLLSQLDMKVYQEVLHGHIA